MKNFLNTTRKCFLDERTLKLLLLLFLFTAVVACKKKPDLPDEPKPGHTEHHGEAIGDPIAKTIGATGGTIATPDGNVNLIVPEGALKSDVKISIQEVENKLGIIAVGKAYRLLPEDIQFEKDVDLTLSFTEYDLNGTNRELLYLAYQDSKGNWHKAGKSIYFPFSNQVSVKTRHFSDWSVWASAKIVLEGKDELFAKETTKVSVVYVAPPADTTDDEDLLAPVKPIPTGLVTLWSPITDGWGHITPEEDKATYRAPDVMTGTMAGTQVELVAYIDLSKLRQGPGRPKVYPPYNIRQKVLIFSDEYLVWDNSQSGGFRHKAETIEKTFSGGSIDVRGKSGASGSSFPRTFYASNPTSTNGDYFFGPIGGAYVRWYDVGRNYSSAYTCNGEDKNTIGSILITNKGGYIEGRVAGTLQWTDRPCNTTETQRVYARFRVKKE